MSKINSEIEKLLILYTHIDKKEIIENIAPELEESVFQVIDDILNLDIYNAIKKIDIILGDTNIYAFYNNIIANLRTSIYILKLKKIQIPSSQISEILNL
jgi:DNA polymerase III delta subunit